LDRGLHGLALRTQGRLNAAGEAASAAAVAPRWSARHDPPLLRHCWGDALFVYHPASGQTHYLNALGADVLDLVEAAPLALPELYASLLARHAIDDDPALHEVLTELMPLLVHLGIVTALP
jgi:PqqD family protein of HPr-rel-A system